MRRRNEGDNEGLGSTWAEQEREQRQFEAKPQPVPGCGDCGPDRPCYDHYIDQVEPDTTTERPLGAIKNVQIGQRVRIEVAAPGIGHNTYEVTKIIDGDVYGRLIESTVRELTIDDVI